MSTVDPRPPPPPPAGPRPPGVRHAAGAGLGAGAGSHPAPGGGPAKRPAGGPQEGAGKPSGAVVHAQPVTQDTRLHRACFRAPIAEVRRALEAVVAANGRRAVDAHDKSGWSPLAVAAYVGRVDAVQVLLEAGAEVGQRTRDGAVPASLAMQQKHLAVVRLLVGTKRMTPDELAPVMWAAAFRPAPAVPAGGTAAPDAMLAMILAAGAPVNAKDAKGQTVLHVACHTGRLDTARALIEAGADLGVTDAQRATPLHIACYRGHRDIVEALVAAGANKDALGGVTPMCVAAQSGHTELVQYLGREGADVDLRELSPLGPAPLFMAVQGGHLATVVILVSLGADVNTAVEDGTTPLFLAAQAGNLDLCAALLEAGAVPNIVRGQERTTPLATACAQGSLATAACLLHHGADPNPANAAGATPLLRACFEGNMDMVELLLNKGASPDMRNAAGASPLMVSVQTGKYPVVARLVAAGAEVNTAVASGVTPLHMAAHRGLKDITEMLLVSGADPGAVDNRGNAPRDVAMGAGHREVADLFTPQHLRMLARISGDGGLGLGLDGGDSASQAPMPQLTGIAGRISDVASRAGAASPMTARGVSPMPPHGHVPGPHSVGHAHGHGHGHHAGLRSPREMAMMGPLSPASTGGRMSTGRPHGVHGHSDGVGRAMRAHMASPRFVA